MLCSVNGFLQFLSGTYSTASFAMGAMSSAGMDALSSLPLCVLSTLCNTCQNNVSDNLQP